MKIPKVLQGKKAEKFEDLDIAMFFHIHNNIKDFSGDDIEKYGTHRFSTWEHNQIKLFYNQPFTSELIGLFEGIIKDSFIADIQVYFIGKERMNVIIDDEDRALVCFGSHKENPFCANTKIRTWETEDGYWHIQCDSDVCGASMNDFDTEELAIKQWNVRSN